MTVTLSILLFHFSLWGKTWGQNLEKTATLVLIHKFQHLSILVLYVSCRSIIQCDPTNIVCSVEAKEQVMWWAT